VERKKGEEENVSFLGRKPEKSRLARRDREFFSSRRKRKKTSEDPRAEKGRETFLSLSRKKIKKKKKEGGERDPSLLPAVPP